MGMHVHQVQVMCAAALNNNAPGGGVCGRRPDKGGHVDKKETNNCETVVKTPLEYKQVRNQVLFPARVKGRILYHGPTAWASSSGCEKLGLMDESLSAFVLWTTTLGSAQNSVWRSCSSSMLVILQLSCMHGCTVVLRSAVIGADDGPSPRAVSKMEVVARPPHSQPCPGD